MIRISIFHSTSLCELNSIKSGLCYDGYNVSSKPYTEFLLASRDYAFVILLTWILQTVLHNTAAWAVTSTI